MKKLKGERPQVKINHARLVVKFVRDHGLQNPSFVSLSLRFILDINYCLNQTDIFYLL